MDMGCSWQFSYSNCTNGKTHLTVQAAGHLWYGDMRIRNEPELQSVAYEFFIECHIVSRYQFRLNSIRLWKMIGTNIAVVVYQTRYVLLSCWLSNCHTTNNKMECSFSYSDSVEDKLDRINKYTHWILCLNKWKTLTVHSY